jgi:hypothetical protein
MSGENQSDALTWRWFGLGLDLLIPLLAQDLGGDTNPLQFSVCFLHQFLTSVPFAWQPVTQIHEGRLTQMADLRAENRQALMELRKAQSKIDLVYSGNIKTW